LENQQSDDPDYLYYCNHLDDIQHTYLVWYCNFHYGNPHIVNSDARPEERNNYCEQEIRLVANPDL
jgi:hypothetical protein